MTAIQNPNELPDCFLNMQTVKDEAEALRVSAGRKAWLFLDALKVLHVYIEI